MKSLTQKTKIWCNNALSRRFGKYSFQALEGLKFQDKQTQKQMIRPIIGLMSNLIRKSWTDSNADVLLIISSHEKNILRGVKQNKDIKVVN